MVPPRAPQWVDLGLPSGTLWLDRLVGAQAPNAIGLFYQWGDIVGHAITEGYEFSTNQYTEKGLDLISSDLDDAHDAARAYYGPAAKMPSDSQYEELINNCVVSYQGSGVYLITSNINGKSFKIRGNGYVSNLQHYSHETLRAWSRSIYIEDSRFAWAFQSNSASSELNYDSRRFVGLNVMAVHS